MGILFGVTLKFQISSILEACLSMFDIISFFFGVSVWGEINSFT